MTTIFQKTCCISRHAPSPNQSYNFQIEFERFSLRQILCTSKNAEKIKSGKTFVIFCFQNKHPDCRVHGAFCQPSNTQCFVYSRTKLR